MNDATTRFHLEYLKGFVAQLCDGNSYLKRGEKRNINFWKKKRIKLFNKIMQQSFISKINFIEAYPS